jgi:hypothetical protein
MHLVAAKDDDHVTRWRERWGHYRAVKNAPHLPPGIRKAMTETSTWLAQAVLIADIQQLPTKFVTLHMGEFPEFSIDLDGELGKRVVLSRD